MSAQVLPGKNIANSIQDNLRQMVLDRQQRCLPVPQLDVILVGNNPASETYVAHKQRACTQVGIISRCHRLPSDSSEEEISALIHRLNQQESTHGILLQLPLPKHIEAEKLIASIDPNKDVDGFHPINMGKLALRQPGLRPCTPYGVITLLKHTQQDLAGQHAVIVGASNIVGRPMALELLLNKCTVTTCHRFTKNLAQHIQNADILISATGKPGIIHSQWIKKGSIVIDVGFSRLTNGQITGDIDFESAKERAAWITPVPGGVGPMTVATLLSNTLQAAQQYD